MRIHVMPEIPDRDTQWACAAIRLIRPFQHRTIQQRAQVTFGSDIPSHGVEMFVIQRSGPRGFTLADAVELHRTARRLGARIVYDIDDDLLSEHPSEKTDREVDPTRPVIRFLLGVADLVITSTGHLRDRVAPLAKQTAVWCNAIDETLIIQGEVAPPRQPPVIGYYGTPSHDADLLPIRAPLDRVLMERGAGWGLELCGILPGGAERVWFPHASTSATRPGIGHYPEFLKNMQQDLGWAIGLAPLNDNSFNRYKSDIKFLEYAVFGVPAVFADLDAYHTVEDGQTGLLAKPDGWYAAITRLMDDDGLRSSIVRNARTLVLETRTLAHAAPGLWDILSSLA